MAGREPDDARARLAAINAEIEAELAEEEAEIEAGFQETLEAIKVAKANPDWYEDGRKQEGRRLLTVGEAEAERRRRLDVARQKAERRKREARENIEAELRLATPDEPAPGSDEQDEHTRGEPYTKAEYEAARRLYRAGRMTVTGIEKHGLSSKRAYRLYRQLNDGAVVVNDVDVLPGPGYRWDPRGSTMTRSGTS